MLDAIFSMPKLKILEMSHIAFSDIISHYNVGGFDLTGIANLEKLQELYVQFNNAIDDSALRKICQNCLNLRALNFSNCRNITDFRGLHAISGLQKLWVAASNKFTDIDLIKVAEKGKLEVFHATFCDVGNSGLLALAEFCPNLTELRIDQCNEIFDESLEKLMKACRKLESLSLQASGVTDLGIFAIRESRPRFLKELDVSFCRNVGDNGAEALLEFVRNRRNGLPLVCYVHQTHVGRSFQSIAMESPITFIF